MIEGTVEVKEMDLEASKEAAIDVKFLKEGTSEELKVELVKKLKEEVQHCITQFLKELNEK